MGKLAANLTPQKLYDTDFYAWTQNQADVLRKRRLGALDVDHVAEELEDLGDAKKNEIESRLVVLLTHLLKWEYQPLGRTNSWIASILEQRFRIARVLKKNPSLKSYPAEILAEEYRLARLRAAGETGLTLSHFPVTCPYAPEQALDEQFFPGPREPTPE